MVRADTHGALELDAFEHERGEFLFNAPQLLRILLVSVFLDRKLLRVSVIARIHAHDFHPLHRFHRGFRFEMNIRDDGNIAAALAKFSDDVLQVRRVLHRGRGDADELATDGDKIKRLLHAGRCIHRIASDHGLRHNGMIAADDHASVHWIADDDFARLAALEDVGRIAVAHERTISWERTQSARLRGARYSHCAPNHRCRRTRSTT